MNILKRIIKKASKSSCKHKVAAIGLGIDGKVINCKFNRPRFSRKGGGIHAEMECIKDLRVRTVIICRVNGTGKVLPLHPCVNCKRILKKLNINVVTVKRT
jgi:cytidine deaminase